MSPSRRRDLGIDLREVRRIHKSLASQLGATFSNRAGKEGRPAIPIGHYAGLVDLGAGRLLALHTDGVGSKVLIAQRMKKFGTIGIDCVAMTVNDLVCLGAEPIALLDYIALEKENRALVGKLAVGLALGAKMASVAIVGGETAVMGEIVRGVGGNGFDLVSMGAGLVRRDSIVDGSAIERGDTVLGVESSGLHSNGYTLARRALRRFKLTDRPEGLTSSLGDALLTPTRIYVAPVLSALKRAKIHGIGHITGGSFGKLSRLVGGRNLEFELELPPPPPIFGVIQRAGRLPDQIMFSTFNMGIGLCVVLPGEASRKVVEEFAAHGFVAHDIGRVRKGVGVHVNGMRLA